MKLRSLFMTCCVLFSTGSVLGQTVAGDALSGTWKGYMGPGATPNVAVTLNLKVESNSSVSGTLVGLPSPGDVKKGTFDAGTGALMLQLGITGQPTAALTLEGVVVNGTATGRVSGDNQSGVFLISKSETPQAGGTISVTELRGGFKEISDWVSKSADMVPAEKYSYKPVDTVRTFGQLIGHIVDSYNYFCAAGSGKKVEWADPAEKGPTDKASVLPKLKQALDTCNAVYGSDSGQFRPLFTNIGHTSLHYGNMITYMRMMGLKPPSS